MFTILKVWWYALDLQNGHPRVRRGAVEALGTLRHPRAVELLIRALGDADFGVSRAAAEALGNLGDQRGVGPLVGVLQSQWDAQRMLTQTLTQLLPKDMRSDPVFIKNLCSDPSSLDPRLLKAMGDLEFEHGLVRRAAAEALGRLGDALAVQPLTIALGDGNSGVRCAAAAALERLGEVKWQPLIKGDMEDFVRLTAAGNPCGFGSLVKALGDRFGKVRRAAAEALGQLGDRRAFEPLVKALADEDGEVRWCVTRALGQLGDRARLSH